MSKNPNNTDETSKLLGFAYKFYTGSNQMQNSIGPMKPSLLLRTGSNILALIASFCSFLFSFTVILGFSSQCFGAGIYQCLFAVIMFLIEIPIICRVTDVQRQIGNFFDEKLTPIIKTIIYVIFAIPPLSLCPCISSIIPAVLILLTAFLNFCSYQNIREQSNQSNSGNNV